MTWIQRSKRKKIEENQLYLPFRNQLPMFFYLSKTLNHLLLPVVWVLVLLLWAGFTRNPKKSKRILWVSILLFFLFSNDWAITRLYKKWEYPIIPLKELKGDYEVAVVLGGFTDLSKEPRDRVYLSQGADRVMHAVLLYKRGRVKKILASGGSGILGFFDATESERIKEILLLCGVDSADILMDNKSRNTWENAGFSKELIQKNLPPNPRVLVFTSAFHCRRAEACFEKVGMQVDMFPVDFRFTDPNFNPERAFIPTDNAWGKWSLLIHEVAGYLVYKCMGYA
jgi:uncharacterized SAM-binding protein YcdF (DUF218 family)